MPEPADRRRTPRHTISSDLRIQFGPPRTELRARLVDLSPCGMLLSAPNIVIAEDMLLQVRLARSDGRGATALGRVVRCDGGGIAFCFDALWVSDEAKLSSADMWRIDPADHLHATIGTPRWWQLWGPPVSIHQGA